MTEPATDKEKINGFLDDAIEALTQAANVMLECKDKYKFPLRSFRSFIREVEEELRDFYRL